MIEVHTPARVSSRVLLKCFFIFEGALNYDHSNCCTGN